MTMTVTTDPLRRVAAGVLVVWLSMLDGAAADSLEDVRQLVVTRTWEERRPDPHGDVVSRDVTAEVWTAAFQRRIDATKRLAIPARAEPYYIDGPLVLPSGSTLVADPEAEIRLVPGSDTCMVRNAQIVGFADRPVPPDCRPSVECDWVLLRFAPPQQRFLGSDGAEWRPAPRRAAAAAWLRGFSDAGRCRGWRAA